MFTSNGDSAGSPLGPTPGRPETYERTRDGAARRWGETSQVVLVPIRDPKRDRMVFAKVDSVSFDALPDSVRNTAWFLAKHSSAAATDKKRFSVRAGSRGSQVSVSRLIMKAGAGEYVANISGDQLDLRVTNLRIKRGEYGKRSKRHDLEVVTGGTKGHHS